MVSLIAICCLLSVGTLSFQGYFGEVQLLILNISNVGVSGTIMLSLDRKLHELLRET
jgi:hypothetical protein